MDFIIGKALNKKNIVVEETKKFTTLKLTEDIDKMVQMIEEEIKATEPESIKEIIPDGILMKDPTPLMPIENVKDIEVVRNEKKEFVDRIKVIAYDKMGKHPLTNYIDLSDREKKAFIKNMNDIQEKYNKEEIIALFNEICNETIFASSSTDYSNYPIYNI